MQVNRTQFEDLYTKLFKPIYKYLYYRTFDHELSMDIAQQTFLRAFEKCDLLKEEIAPQLLYTIARNQLIDHFRKKKPVVVKDFETALAAKTTDQTIPSAEDQWSKQELGSLIQKLLEYLPDAEQEVIRMKYLQELENREIAIILNKTEENVRQIQSRAIKKLRLLYEKETIYN